LYHGHNSLRPTYISIAYVLRKVKSTKVPVIRLSADNPQFDCLWLLPYNAGGVMSEPLEPRLAECQRHSGNGDVCPMVMNRSLLHGLELSRLLYEEAVRPILSRHLPGLIYSAALLGFGSDVLGYDTPQSMDHDWGPRLMLFLSAADQGRYGDDTTGLLAQELPVQVHGYPVHFEKNTDGTGRMAPVEHGPLNHRVTVHTVSGFFQDFLRWDAAREPSVAEWLSFPQQRLRAATAGAVFHDGLGELEPARARLQWYPHDVWLYLLAGQWQRIAQEEPFMGRCAQVGDDLGSRLLAARLVRDLMRLCFLMERQYAPYIKWLGTAFAELPCAARLRPSLAGALRARSWKKREEHLSTAYQILARMHNALGITDTLPSKVSPFWGRPFQVIHADQFAAAIRAAIRDEQVRALPAHLGGIDQWVDSTDVLDEPDRFAGLRATYLLGE
jgi:hypothetical protein